VVHERQGLTLGLEAGEDFMGVHAGLDEFQCDGAANRGGLVGLPDYAHAPGANPLAEDEGADGTAGLGIGVDGIRGVRSSVPLRISLGRAVAHLIILAAGQGFAQSRSERV
jgi:hypothetical protein